MAQAPKKYTMFLKALRILHKELNKFERKAEIKGLDSQDRKDVVMILKALETEVTKIVTNKNKVADDKLLKEVEAIMASLKGEKSEGPQGT